MLLTLGDGKDLTLEVLATINVDATSEFLTADVDDGTSDKTFPPLFSIV